MENFIVPIVIAVMVIIACMVFATNKTGYENEDNWPW